MYDPLVFLPSLNKTPVWLEAGNMHPCAEIMPISLTVLAHPCKADKQLMLHRDWCLATAAGYPMPEFELFGGA
jgi:hypothetical protein